MRVYVFLACTVSVALSQQASAQQAPPPAQALSSPRPSTLVPPVRPFRLPPRTGVETQREITLEQALTMALANNKDIEASRIDQLESEYTLTAAQGAFDPQLNVNSYWEQQITPIASALGGSSTGSLLNKTWLSDPGITQPLPWYGGTFKTDLSSADAYSNNTFLSLNPQYDIVKLLRLYDAGKLKLDELVTRHYRLEDINQGYADLRAGEIIRGVILHGS